MKPQPQKATQQQTKTYNSQLVLKTIYDQGQISRADMARLTHLTRTTVSDLVAELQDKGLVQEVGYGPSLGGRSPILLSMVDDARHVIALDLANDEFRGAVLNLRNKILQTVSLPLPRRDGTEALALVYELVDRLVGSTDTALLGIGVGTPGLVDMTNGVVLRSVNLAWRDMPLGRLLQDRYQLPAYVTNDSQAAALAQHMFGGNLTDDNLVVIKVGHGLGAGIILNGRLFQGDGFGAGEIGHVVVVDEGAQCRCGNFGCLETVVSNRAIRTRAQALAQATPHSLLNRWAPDPTAITLDMVRRAVAAGDSAAQQIVREIGRYLGIATAYLISTLNIRRIVLMGSVSQFGAPLLDAIRQEMLRRALPVLAEGTLVELAADSPDNVILGASALLLTHELGLNLAR